MTTFRILVLRNTKLFFKDKGMFFTALITPMILLVLYATFLGNVFRDAFLSGIPEGIIVPDELIATMIKDVIAESTGDVTMLLDGFPRNVAQADILEKTGAEIRSVVLIDVPDSVIQDRIAGRRTCPACKAGYHVKALPPKVEGKCDKCGADLVIRKDDNPETVKDRLVVYHQQTEPLIAYYKEKGLLRVVDGDQGPEKNAEAFKAAM